MNADRAARFRELMNTNVWNDIKAEAAKRQAMTAALQQQYGMFPWFNTLGAAKSQIAGLGEDESTFILPDAVAIQIMEKAQEIGAGMADQMVSESGQMSGQQSEAKGPPK